MKKNLSEPSGKATPWGGNSVLFGEQGPLELDSLGSDLGKFLKLSVHQVPHL